jgi:putative oxidoreductase
LLIVLGLITRPTSLFVAGHFVFVVFLAHAGDAFRQRELALFFLVGALLFLLAGAGRYSVDALIRGRAR